MSYCELNDAFKNMNYKLIETFDGVTSEDIPFINQEKKNSMRTDYTNSEEEQTVSNNLNGTYLSNLQNIKLTHRECINFYLNPPPNNNPNFQQAMKHLQNCNLCKEEIYKNIKKINNKNNINKNIINDNNKLSNINSNELEFLLKKYVEEDKNNKIVNYNNKNELTLENNLSYNNNKLSNINSNELEFLLKKYAEEDKNNKIQNMLFETKLSKYFETNQEKKEINDNLNKIYNILNYGMKKDNDKKPLSIEINYISIGISILIILLIIDIILRIKA